MDNHYQNISQYRKKDSVYLDNFYIICFNEYVIIFKIYAFILIFSIFLERNIVLIKVYIYNWMLLHIQVEINILD